MPNLFKLNGLKTGLNQADELNQELQEETGGARPGGSVSFAMLKTETGNEVGNSISTGDRPAATTASAAST